MTDRPRGNNERVTAALNPRSILNNFTVLTTNARSLKPKIHSLLDYFDELDIAVALISETWLKDNEETERLCTDAVHRKGVKIIAKHRPQKKNRRFVAGGRIAISYNTNKITLKNYALCNNPFEIVAAVGKLPNIKRRNVTISATKTQQEPNDRTCGIQCVHDRQGKEGL